MSTHRHDWQPNPALDPDQPGHNPNAPTYACTECPATASQCGTCPNVLEQTGRTCPDCVSKARNHLRDVRDLYRQLPDVIATVAGLHAVRYDQRGGKPGKVRATDTTIVGGAAFVMAAGGTATGHRLGRGETSIDPALLDAERHDPPSVWATITFWEDAWRAEHGDPAAPTNSLDDAIRYLLDHTDWAAQQSATWDEWLTDLGNLRGRLRRLTGESQPPVSEAAPCVHCGGTVQRGWSNEGLSDLRKCAQCGMTWPDEDRLRFTNHLRILAAPMTDPAVLVTTEQARIALPDLKRNTLNQVLKRDRDRTDPEHRDYDPHWVRRLPEHGRNVRGEVLYLLSDITAIITPEKAAV